MRTAAFARSSKALASAVQFFCFLVVFFGLFFGFFFFGYAYSCAGAILNDACRTYYLHNILH